MSHIEYNSRAQGPLAPIASSSYDHDEKHFRFQRSHTGDAPERTEPLSGWGYDLLALAGIAACVALLWFGAWVLSAIFA